MNGWTDLAHSPFVVYLSGQGSWERKIKNNTSIKVDIDMIVRSKNCTTFLGEHALLSNHRLKSVTDYKGIPKSIYDKEYIYRYTGGIYLIKFGLAKGAEAMIKLSFSNF